MVLEGLALAYRCPGQLRQEHSGSVFTFETPQVRQHLGGFALGAYFCANRSKEPKAVQQASA